MKNVRLIILIDCIIYALCIVGLWQVEEKANLPFPVSFQQDSSFVVGADFPQSYRVQEGDRIVSINGITPETVEDIEFILDGSRAGSLASVEVERGTENFIVPVALVHNYGQFYLVVAWFVGTLFFLSGLVVLFYKQGDKAALVYHFGAVGVAAILMMTWGSYAIPPAGLGQTIRAIFSTAYVFVPVLLLHLSLVFPSRKRDALLRLVKFLYVIALVLSICMGITFFKATFPVSIEKFHSFIFFFNITRWVYAGCVGLSILLFIGSYRSSREEMERRKLRWVFLGLAISSLGFVTLWQVPQLLTSHGLIREEFVILLSVATPVAFAVAIVRYHLLDVDFIINRSTVYIIVVAIVLSIYAIIVGAATAFIEGITVPISIFVSAFAAVAVALLFEPVRKKVQDFVDRSFFRIGYDMQEVEKKLIDSINACVTLDKLANLVVKVIKDTIPVEKIGFFSLSKPDDRLHLVAGENLDVLSARSVEFDRSTLKASLRLPVILEHRAEPGAKFEKADEEMFCRWKIVVALPFRSENEEIIGFLVLGEKKSGLRYSIEDIELLTSVALQVELAFQRIILQRNLVFEQEERERLEELNRLKTYFVSSVSHDLKTPLTAIRMFAEMLGSQEGISRQKFHRYLETIDGESRRLTRLIDNVLTVSKAERANIAYDFKEIDLNEVVRNVMITVGYELRKEKCKAKLRLSRRGNYIFGDHDAITEALANLVSNAAQYSKKKREILIETFSRDGFVCLSVKDYGIGIPRDELPYVFQPFYRGKLSSSIRRGGTGLGLPVVKNIMDAHRGKIEIESTPESGTKVTLVFPSKERK